ncbi:unnamed protein product [Bursaphelenchus xylophilus]|uniref:ADAM10 endopeptidase n=1 Tax=Bursaphelenchus xylophilus TaxID=6326 RepID=A0A1I7SFI5_BURXY|nr:unnamed protein product [Bursaphelenchus xylophilus]CAG9079083.1 unnamed protein product [Bursaphelenchus xylophilus]
MSKNVVFLVVALSLLQNAVALNKYVDDFETLSYRPILDRRKRDTDGSHSIRFKSHNRLFHLKLYPISENSNDIFSDDHFLDVNGEYQSHLIRPAQFLYEGHVVGDPRSKVFGSLLDGLFDGHIILGNGETFTVEKAARYFDVDSRPENYHSIIYKDEQINHNKFRPKRDVPEEHESKDGHDHDSDGDADHGCGLNSETKAAMMKIQTSAAYKFEPVNEYNETIRRKSHLSFDLMDDRLNNRTKRSLPERILEVNGRKIYSVRTCSIYMQADQKLYVHVFHKEGNHDPIRTREEIVSLFYNHIKAVNHIYENTNFGGITGLNFVIQRTTIYTNETCSGGKPTENSDNPFCADNVDVSNYLNLNSQRNHSSFCLAYALTFRDFIGGTLGLAWVASPNYNTAGGICQIYQKYNEGSRGMVSRSLNTGIVTLVNYGNRVPARVSQLTLAHEIGHNFGSPHDYPSECQPGLPDGNYIMFSSATSGDKPNNARFSKCSIANMSVVLYEVLSQPPVNPAFSNLMMSSKKRNCFQERTSAFCGNQIKEPGEECDCGFSDLDCKQMNDRCCQPHEREGVFSAGACKRKPEARCSPSEGQCCDPISCGFFSAVAKRKCREESECLYSQFCNGYQPECPDSKPKRDGLPCQDATKVCHAGACNGSICAHVGLKDCFLTEGKPDELCHLACEKNGKCVSTLELPEFAAGVFHQQSREGRPGLLLHPGSPCNNYKGYCDIFRKCRSVDANGPLARLKNLLFNKQTIQTVSQWSRENWWACILIGIGVLFVMALFVKCCAVHTPSTNPNKLPAQHFSDTLRHPGTLLRRGRPRNGAYAVAEETARQQRPRGTTAPSNRQNRQRRHRSDQRQEPQTSQAQSRVPPTLTAPPLIPPPAATEPPPPYSATDPSAALPTPTAPPTSTPPTANRHTSPVPKPVALPGAPPPPAPPTSTIPLNIPGPPNGQGPKPGRRKPKQPQKAGKKDEKRK